MHKGSFGHVAILEGAPKTKGASRLAALGALRAGAGLVTLLVPRISPSLPDALPEVMQERWDLVDLSKINALVIGPGLGNGFWEQRRAKILLRRAKQKGVAIVVDAEALGLLQTRHPHPALSRTAGEGFNTTVVATPHPGEAARLLKTTPAQIQADRQAAIRSLVLLVPDVLWVLKGANTLVCQPGHEPTQCHGDIPALAVAGSGDVLSGIIAGRLCQTKDPFEATVSAVTAHLEAGRVLQKTAPRGHLAHEIADALRNIHFT